MKQRNIGNWWGAFMTLAGRVSAYVSIINLVLLAIFAYPSVSGFISSYISIVIPFWAFMLIIVLLPFTMMMFEYIFGLPSFIAFNNQQAYKHGNPIRIDIEILKEDATEIRKIVEKLLVMGEQK
jgi:hypothetical protein